MRKGTRGVNRRGPNDRYKERKRVTTATAEDRTTATAEEGVGEREGTRGTNGRKGRLQRSELNGMEGIERERERRTKRANR